MGLSDFNHALKNVTSEINSFTKHIQETPKEVTKQEASSLVKTIQSTLEKAPAQGKMTEANFSKQVPQASVNNVNKALTNLFNFLNANPNIDKLVSSLAGIEFKQRIESFKKKSEELRRKPKRPTIFTVVKTEKGAQ